MGFTLAAALPPHSGVRRFAGGLILLGAVLSARGLLALQSGDSSPPLLALNLEAYRRQRASVQRHNQWFQTVRTPQDILGDTKL